MSANIQHELLSHITRLVHYERPCYLNFIGLTVMTFWVEKIRRRSISSEFCSATTVVRENERSVRSLVGYRTSVDMAGSVPFPAKKGHRAVAGGTSPGHSAHAGGRQHHHIIHGSGSTGSYCKIAAIVSFWP